MMKQFILTMRSDFAERYKHNVKVLDGRTLLRGLDTARLIGSLGYSMRVAVAPEEVQAMMDALDDRFLIEPDHVFHTFSKRAKPRLSLARRVSRRAPALRA
jgi:hypothetical protein